MGEGGPEVDDDGVINEVVEERLMVVWDLVGKAADALGKAQRSHADTVALANHRVHVAERRLTRALHGVPLDRWGKIADGRASLRDPRRAREVHRASKSKHEVEAALAALAAAQSASEAKCRRSRTDLDVAIARIHSYGRLGERLIGYSVADSDRIADGPIATRVQRDARRENARLTTRDTVRDCQRRLARLDAVHTRAKGQLEAARQKRSEMLAAQDEQVSDAQQEVDMAVVAMASEVGAELAAKLIGLKVSEVRRLLKRQK